MSEPTDRNQVECRRVATVLPGTYPERYEDRYGFFRPVIRETVYKYLGCGDLRQGFARVRRSECGHEYLLTFSRIVTIA